MKLGTADIPVFRSHPGNAFELSPPAGTELATETHDIVDPAPYGDQSNVAYLIDEFKVHSQYSRGRT